MGGVRRAREIRDILTRRTDLCEIGIYAVLLGDAKVEGVTR